MGGREIWYQMNDSPVIKCNVGYGEQWGGNMQRTRLLFFHHAPVQTIDDRIAVLSEGSSKFTMPRQEDYCPRPSNGREKPRVNAFILWLPALEPTSTVREWTGS